MGQVVCDSKPFNECHANGGKPLWSAVGFTPLSFVDGGFYRQLQKEKELPN
jgi:hypothetical protein